MLYTLAMLVERPATSSTSSSSTSTPLHTADVSNVDTSSSNADAATNASGLRVVITGALTSMTRTAARQGMNDNIGV